MKRRHVLYVEDDANDAHLAERAFRAEHFAEWLHVVPDGVEAIAWLAGDGDYEDRHRYPLPGLVLSDIKMPRADGFAVLRWIRAQPAFAALPVIIFSGSYQEPDIRNAYRLGGTLFISKPMTLHGLRQVAQLAKAWLELGLPPPEGEGFRFPLHKPMGYQTWGD